MSAPVHISSASEVGFAGLEDELVDFVGLPVTGQLPADLRGTLYRIGPSRFDVYGSRYRHWFDGDGMVHEFRIGGGRIRYRNRFVATQGKLAEDLAQRRLFAGGFATRPPGGPLHRLRNWRPKNVANINVVRHGDDLWALWEGGHPHRLDPETLDTIGEDDLGVLPKGAGFSAHPHRDPDTGDLWNFGVTNGAKTSLALYQRELGRSWRRFAATTIAPHMIHDFGLTATRAVFALVPLTLPRVPLGLVTGSKSYADSLRWRSKLGTTILAIDRRSGAVQTWATESFMAFHVINAWEEGTDVVLELVVFKDDTIVRTLQVPTSEGAMVSPTGRPIRLRLAASGAVHREAIADLEFDFPRLPGEAMGQPTRVSYGLTRLGTDGFLDTPVALDLRTGCAATAPHAAGTVAGEPIPIGELDSGGARWVLTLVLDANAGASELWLYRGDDLGVGPIATARLPHVVPFGLHGNWITA